MLLDTPCRICVFFYRFFEKSNQLLANQSDSMQNNAAQAMAKVSVLEQRTVCDNTLKFEPILVKLASGHTKFQTLIRLIYFFIYIFINQT